MTPSGFLSLRRESGQSQSSMDNHPEVINPDAFHTSGPQYHSSGGIRPMSDTEKLKLKEADQKAKEGIKVHYFPKDKAVYSCRGCLVPVALQDELVSKSFSGRDGRAYLMHSTVNTKMGKPEERRLLTGLHTVADLFCISCDASLGWTYLKAQDRDQIYKEGKYILEASKCIKENNWSLDS